MKLEKYSIGIGDRFARQGKAQLMALKEARDRGIEVVPVWNKSHREHTIIKTEPIDTCKEAEEAVKALSWPHSFYVDADHINMKNVSGFVDSSNFFTIDIADYIGEPASKEEIDGFIKNHEKYIGELHIPGIENPFNITKSKLEEFANKYLNAIKAASEIYQYIKRSGKDFITEVSMDEVDIPQTPEELLFILSGLAGQGIPLQTIAPKFSGRFNKGVDYIGDVKAFSKEFKEDILVIAFAIKEFGLPANLKLSVHSGSDKFSIYEPINKIIKELDAGLHIKTAGTTWLEEVIGLAEAGGEGLRLVKNIYSKAYFKIDALCKPYATVIDIDKNALPSPDKIEGWTEMDFVRALKHDQDCPDYNINMRQFIHVSYKIAADFGEKYYNALEKYKEIIAKHVTENIFKRHIIPVFG